MNASFVRKPFLVLIWFMVLIILITAVASAQEVPAPNEKLTAEPNFLRPFPPGKDNGLPIMSEWIDSQGRQPTSYADWKSSQPVRAPTRIEQRFSSLDDANHIERRVSAGEKLLVLALVNSNIYDGIAADLDRWANDLLEEGWDVVIEKANFENKWDLRNHLKTKNDLDSCLLIGDFPVPWFEIDGSAFPIDLFYMDLDGAWQDTDSDGILDKHTGDESPEIGLGRLTAGPLTFAADEVTLLKGYFNQNHAYREGELSRPSQALLFTDNDWAGDPSHPYDGLLSIYNYQAVDVILNPWATSADTLKESLDLPYQWAIIQTHSSSFAQSVFPRARFNFQPEKSPWVTDRDFPLSWIDNGHEYLTMDHFDADYGWNEYLGDRVHDRNMVPNQRYDTLIDMQIDDELSASWEAEAPKGTYCVDEMIAGDPIYHDGHYIMDMEGVTVLEGAPTADQPFVEVFLGPCTEVHDGRITLTSHPGARKNRLAYIDLQLAGAANSVDNMEIVQIGPEALFYNLFSCSAGNYIEQNYIAGYYIFSDSPTLAAIASTKTGSMLNYVNFYQPMGQGSSLGESFRLWFVDIIDLGKNDPNYDHRAWHYGMTLLGDPTLKTTGQIAGTVTNELTGTPVPDLNVELLRYNNADDYWESEKAAVTNHMGMYSIVGVLPGPYRVHFIDYSGDYIGEYYDDAPAVTSAQDVQVEAGHTTAGIDARLVPTGAISGTVKAEITGTPLANIDVSIWRCDDTGQCMETSGWQTTGNDGVYQVAGLIPGFYIVQFSDNSAIYAGEFFDDVIDEEEAEKVQVASGKTTKEIDAELSLAGTIEGKVVAEADGSNLAGLNVEVFHYNSANKTWDYSADGITNEVGIYQIGGLHPGNYRVYFIDFTRTYAAQYYDGHLDVEEAKDVPVRSGRTTVEIDASLASPNLPGNDDIEAAVAVHSLPYRHAQVTIAATEHDDDPTLSCGEGSHFNTVWFTFSPQVDGPVTISSAQSDYDTILGLWQGSPGSLKHIACNDDVEAFGSNAHLEDVNLEAGNSYYIEVASFNKEGGTLILSLSTEPGAISGVVADESDGSLLPDIGIDVLHFNPNVERWEIVGSSKTDKAGQYRVNLLYPGIYRVKFYDDSDYYFEEYYDDAETLSVAQDLVVSAGHTTSEINAALIVREFVNSFPVVVK